MFPLGHHSGSERASSWPIAVMIPPTLFFLGGGHSPVTAAFSPQHLLWTLTWSSNHIFHPNHLIYCEKECSLFYRQKASSGKLETERVHEPGPAETLFIPKSLEPCSQSVWFKNLYPYRMVSARLRTIHKVWRAPFGFSHVFHCPEYYGTQRTVTLLTIQYIHIWVLYKLQDECCLVVLLIYQFWNVDNKP